MPKIYNVTGWDVEAKAMGIEYKIPAFTEIDIYDLYHADHILRTFKKYGIISLEYGPKAQEMFKTYAEYRKNQEVIGLKQALKFKEQNLRDEKQAERDVIHHRGPEGYKSMLNIEGFQKEVTLLKKWIVEAGGVIDRKVDAKPVVTERPKQETDRVAPKETEEKTEEKTEETEEKTEEKTEKPRRGRPRKADNGKPRTDENKDAVSA